MILRTIKPLLMSMEFNRNILRTIKPRLMSMEFNRNSLFLTK